MSTAAPVYFVGFQFSCLQEQSIDLFSQCQQEIYKMQPTTFEKPVRATYHGTALSHLQLKLTLNMANRTGKRAVCVNIMTSIAQALFCIC